MKAKNGNDVIAKHVELGKFDEHLYLQKGGEEEAREKEIAEEHELYLQREKELFEEKYNENVKEYKEGNFIDTEMFLEMLLRNNIYVHPRTKHTIANNLEGVCAGGVWNKAGKKGNTAKIFEAIYELNEKLNSKE